MKLIVHRPKSRNIYLNLTFEHTLLSTLQADEKHFIVWKNNPCIVMGRFQNPWHECNFPAMVADEVDLVRRYSGGGTVYHDLGNLCISFIDWNHNYSKEVNCDLLAQALGKQDIKARVSPRHDLYVPNGSERLKISGAAFKQKRDRSLHHMTLLMSSDLDKLNHYLHPRVERESIESRAIDSVRSTVMNTGVDEEEFFQVFVAHIGQTYGKEVRVIEWSEQEVRQFCQQSLAVHEELLSWKWIFGETPRFDTRFAHAGFEVRFSSRKGVIEDIQVEHNFIHPSLLAEFSRCLVNKTLRREELENALSRLEMEGIEQYGQAFKSLADRLRSDFFF